MVFLFGTYLDKMSDREHIAKAKKASNLTGMTEDDIDAFKKIIKAETKNIEAIKATVDAMASQSSGSTEEDKAKK